jgi:hypothetical protein
MDLYGDLPPTNDGSSNDLNPVVIGAGWAKPGASLVPTLTVHSTKKVEENKKTAPKFLMPQPTVKRAALAASFKPRQAAKATVTPPTVPASLAQPSGLLGPVVTSEIITRKKLGESDAHVTLLSVDASFPSIFDQSSITSPDIEPSNPASLTYDSKDPYDPSKPNDYITWCEERMNRRKMRQLEKENKKAIEEMERVRAALEAERALAMQQGDMAKLQATLPSMGRGRGRGMSNLPAWMTASGNDMGGIEGGSTLQSPMKQPSQESDSDIAQYQRQGQFDDVSADDGSMADLGSRMLSNMGYEGRGTGLGKAGQGMVNAIQVSRGDGGQARLNVTDDDNDRFMRTRVERRDVHTAAEGSSINASTVSDESLFGNASNASSGGGLVGAKRKGLFSNPSCVVLIKNMVAAGDVDSNLAPETKEECHKYGQVKSCLVREVPPSLPWCEFVPESERVRTFVCFDRQDSAVRAYRDLNGRFFGGRQISAVFYDESKYDSMDLDPAPGEW